MTNHSPSATVFLTGATGFIGGRLAEVLTHHGYRLRCLVRAPERAGGLAALGAELVVGDIADAAAMARGAAGAGLAYHVAGQYDVGVVDVAEMERVNVEGTRVFLDAVRRAAVPRAVHVSTTAALGPTRDAEGGGGGEAGDYTGPYPTEYHRTKTQAHRLARAAQAAGLPLIIACPAYVYGPGDEGPAGRYIRDLLAHRVPGLSTRPSEFSYVHVDDVAAGLAAAGEEGTAGATYVLGGEPATVNEFSRMVGEIAGTWVSPLRFPPFAVRLTGSMLDAVTRLTGRRMPISREAAEVAGTGERWVHSYARSVAELGYSPRPLAEGLPDTVNDAMARL
jgi:dihydroflavonol-4-reductase